MTRTQIPKLNTGAWKPLIFLLPMTSLNYESRDENIIFESAARPRNNFRNFRLWIQKLSASSGRSVFFLTLRPVLLLGF